MQGILLLLSIALITSQFFQASATSAKGTVELDEHSFDKVISKFDATLVKFDVAFPYGEKHEAFVTLAKEAKDVYDLLVAEVGVKDYGEKDNEALAKKYGATKDNFPVVMLLVNGKEEPVRFDDSKGFTTDELRRFVLENTNMYISLPGCVRKLDNIAIKFMKAKENDRKNLLKEAELALEAFKTKKEEVSGKIYKTIMEKILEKGDQFVKTETERVKKILNSKVSDEKKKELKIKINILQSFDLLAKRPRKDDL